MKLLKNFKDTFSGIAEALYNPNKDWQKNNPTVDESFESTMDLLTEGQRESKQKAIIDFMSNLQNESGNPYINVREGDGRASYRPAYPSITDYTIDYDNPKNLKNTYESRPDTITAYQNTILGDLMAEYPHAQQIKEVSEGSVLGKLIWPTKVTVENWALRILPKLLTGKEPIYNIPGTFEHDAHSVREPKIKEKYLETLKKEIEERYKIKIDDL